MIKINKLEKIYDTQKVLHDLSLNIEHNEFVAIMGKSGSGKTTLLNILATLDVPTTGSVYIGNKDILSLKEKERANYRKYDVGLIFQDYKLLNSLTARENINQSLLLIRQKDKKIIDEIAQMLDISQILDKYPHQLSGGQKQRIAIARALVKKPKIILADEPTGALDSKNSKQIMDYLQLIHQQLGTTIVMVTHDLEVASYATKIIVLKDGRVVSEFANNSDKELADLMSLL